MGDLQSLGRWSASDTGLSPWHKVNLPSSLRPRPLRAVYRPCSRGDLCPHTSAFPVTNDPSVLPRTKRPSEVSYGSTAINFFSASCGQTVTKEGQGFCPERTWHGPHRSLSLCLPCRSPRASLPPGPDLWSSAGSCPQWPAQPVV